MLQVLKLTHAVRQVKVFGKTYRRRNGFVNKLVQRINTYDLKHFPHVIFTRS